MQTWPKLDFLRERASAEPGKNLNFTVAPPHSFSAFLSAVMLLREDLELAVMEDSNGDEVVRLGTDQQWVYFYAQPQINSLQSGHYYWFDYTNYKDLCRLLKEVLPRESLEEASSVGMVGAFVRRAINELQVSDEYEVEEDEDTVCLVSKKEGLVASFPAELAQTYEEVKSEVYDLVSHFLTVEAYDFGLFVDMLKEMAREELFGVLQVQPFENDGETGVSAVITTSKNRRVAVHFSAESWKGFASRECLYDFLMAEVMVEKPVWSFAAFCAFLKKLRQESFPDLWLELESTDNGKEYLRVRSQDEKVTYFFTSFRPSKSHVRGAISEKTGRRLYTFYYAEFCNTDTLKVIIENDLGCACDMPLLEVERRSTG